MQALHEKPGLAAEKLQWLQRHDPESGDLYGMLPLIHNMPVTLTDHIDRNPETQLLKGKVGYIHSWVLNVQEASVPANGKRVLNHLPLVVFVKFPEATWRLPSLDEDGLYPIKPKNGHWFLDKGRKHSVLKITRQQPPLAPAFAMTAHAAQGQTLEAAIIDLQIGKGTSPISSYVALTRVKRKEALLIYRAFERKLFTGGPLQGPELLLKVLRGESVDWDAIEAEYTPRAACTECGFVRFKDEFALSQWNRKDKRRFCKPCVQRFVCAGTPLECMICSRWKHEDAFTNEDRLVRVRRVCMDCVDVRLCKGVCGKYLSEAHFTRGEWQHALKSHPARGKCRSCFARHKEKKTCIVCENPWPRGSYSKKAWENVGDNQRKCRSCIEENTLDWKCKEGAQRKPRDEFTVWLSANKKKSPDGKEYCDECHENNNFKLRNHWRCIQCKGVFHKVQFSQWVATRTTVSNKSTARCNTCKNEEVVANARLAKASLDHMTR